MPPIDAPVCHVCGDPRPANVTSGCVRCRRSQHVIARARSAGLYDGRLRDAIHAFKYDGRRTLAAPLAALMRARGAEALAGADLAVAVPLHRSRLRERGFNQAEDLAAHLGLPVARVLRRVRATRPQTSLEAHERRENVSRAFAARRWARSILGAIIVIVDDVMTTGATLDACARVLRRSGAREVRALTAGRVVQPQR
jgi:ComF family protein